MQGVRKAPFRILGNSANCQNFSDVSTASLSNKREHQDSVVLRSTNSRSNVSQVSDASRIRTSVSCNQTSGSWGMACMGFRGKGAMKQNRHGKRWCRFLQTGGPRYRLGYAGNTKGAALSRVVLKIPGVLKLLYDEFQERLPQTGRALLRNQAVPSSQWVLMTSQTELEAFLNRSQNPTQNDEFGGR